MADVRWKRGTSEPRKLTEDAAAQHLVRRSLAECLFNANPCDTVTSGFGQEQTFDFKGRPD
jgi:hypothetical protein